MLHFKHSKLFKFTSSCLLIVSLGLSSPALANKVKKDKIKVKVLQNAESNDCNFMGEVLLRVKYKLRTQDAARLVVEVSHDSLSYFEATAIDVTRGKDVTIIGVDVGKCAADMRVVFGEV